MKRRLLALLLVLAMLLPMIPMGTLAEEDVAAYAVSDSYVIASAEDPYGFGTVTVTAEYQLSDADRNRIEQLHIVAAAFEYGRMVTSVHRVCDASVSGGTETLELGFIPDDCTIRVFLLDENNMLLADSNGTWLGKEEPSGQEGSISWKLVDSTLYLTGSGDTEMEANGEYGWNGVAGQVNRLVMTGISNISSGAFCEFDSLQSVDLGDVKRIGYGAFWDCDRLSYVDGEVREVGQQAFENCASLSYINLSACTYVDDYAFAGCSSLSYPDLYQVVYLGYGAFENSGITFANLSSLEGSVAQLAFAGCEKLKECYLPDEGLTYIDEEAFLGSGLESIYIPGTVETIYPYAFVGCRSLKSLTIGEGVKSIGAYAFGGAPIQELYLPEGVTEIGTYAFASCQELKECTLPSTLTSIGDYAFTGMTDLTVYAPEGLLNSLKEQGKIGRGNDVLFQTVEEKQEQAAEEPTEETVPETTEETVPETTEETVPETTEETVPETAEEAAPETEEELTSEEAALDGYYIAPEGAELQEEVSLEEMAAFGGTDKVSKGLHTASFTGLVPQKLYVFIVSRNPGSLEDEDLKYIDTIASDANGAAQFRYYPKDEEGGIVQLYGPELLTLQAEQDYLSLRPGETAVLRFICNSENAGIWATGYNDGLNIGEDEQGNFLISISDYYQVNEVESKYITFEAHADGQGASVKVRVDLIPDGSQVTGASLGETAVTHNYYSSEATPIPVFLTVETPEVSEDTVSTQSAFETGENAGLIQAVEFSENTDKVVKNAFEVQVQDDHTLLLLTRVAAENDADGEEIDFGSIAKQLKSSYTLGFRLTIQGQDDPIEVSGLKLNVQKKLPTLKAATVTLNTYAKTSGAVTITGGEVQTLVPYDNNLVTLECGEDGSVIAKLLQSTTKSSTVNLTADVWVKGYNQPVTVKVPVKIDAKAPSFKLGQTTWNLCSIGLQLVEIPVQCTTKGIDIEDLEFDEDLIVSGAEGYEAFFYGGVLYVVAHPPVDEEGNEIGRAAGKKNLTIQTSIVCGDIKTPVTWKLTVNNQDPKLKLNKSSLTMNIWMAAGASLKATITGIPEDWEAFEDYGVSYVISNKRFPNAGDYFALKWDGVDSLFLEPNNSAIMGMAEEDFDRFMKETFTLAVGVSGTDESKWNKVSVKLVQDQPTISSVKASGAIDLNNDDSRVTLTPTFKGKLSVASLLLAVTDEDGTEYSFNYYMDGDKIVLFRNHEAESPEPGTYTATVTAYWFDTPSTASTTFKVVENKPTIKVTGKLDSGKGTMATVTSGYKHYVVDEWGGYSLAQPTDVILTTTGKDPQVVSKDLYDYWTDWSDGSVTIYPLVYNEELLRAGKYTVTLDYGNGMVLAAPITVTQTLPTMKLYKTSVTLHPGFEAYDGNNNENTVVIPVGFGSGEPYTEFAAYEFYQANGKTKWDDQPYVSMERFDLSAGEIRLSPTGATPAKDTTVKIKVFQDYRIQSKFSWITVKVLGGKSLNKKLTVKAKNALDPSYQNASTEFTVSMSGFDNKYMSGTGRLQKYVDKKTGWVDVNSSSYYLSVYSTIAYLDVYGDNALDVNGKYRVEMSFGGHITGTVALKVAYGKNTYSVDKAPTLYKRDPQAHMYIHINQKNMEQQIDRVTIKGNTGFAIERTYNHNYGRNDWTIQYTGNTAKLKTTTLPLQIFLKGNNTAKPNATLNVKVTVK